MKAADPLRRDLKDYYGGSNKWTSRKRSDSVNAAGNKFNID